MAFALAMGGGAQAADPEHSANRDSENGSIASVPIQSCIAFMNTIDKSRNMAAELQTPTVREWLQRWLDRNRPGQAAAAYTL